MKHRFLMTAIVSIALTAGISTITPVTKPQNVVAISKHSWRLHWVRLTKKRALFKVRYPLATHRPKFVRMLRKGSHIKIAYDAWDGFYYVKHRGRGHWIIEGRSTNWFRNVKR